jgi:hypothetical protein
MGQDARHEESPQKERPPTTHLSSGTLKWSPSMGSTTRYETVSVRCCPCACNERVR